MANIIKNNKIIASLCSIPEREASLKETVASILPNIDHLNVFLNEYERVPDFLIDKKITFARSQDYEDRGDANKFFWADKLNDCIHFVCDDDLIYSKEYFDYMIKRLIDFDCQAIVGLHGSIFHKNFNSYYRDRDLYSNKKKYPHDINVHILATSSLCYHTSTIKVSLCDFKIKNMADIWFGILGQKQKIPFIRVSTNKRYLTLTRTYNITETIFYQSDKNTGSKFDNSEHINDIIKKNQPWKIFYVKKTLYIRNIDNLLNIDRYIHHINFLLNETAYFSDYFKVIDVKEVLKINFKMYNVLIIDINSIFLKYENLENIIDKIRGFKKRKICIFIDIHNYTFKGYNNLKNLMYKFGITDIISRFDCDELNVVKRYCSYFQYHIIPYHINFNIYYDYKLEKRYDILLYGMTTPSYPFRKRLFNLLKERKDFKIYHIEAKLPYSILGDKLAKIINQSWITIATCSKYDYLLKKYFEISACKSVVAGNMATSGKDIWGDNFIELDDKMSDKKIIDILKSSLENKEELIRKSNVMYDKIFSEFNCKKYPEKIDQILSKPILKVIYIASLCSIPERVKCLKDAVESILPHVDYLNVFLNNYKSVPDFLINNKITFARSQDYEDRGSGNKFFFAADIRIKYINSNDVRCIHFTCDDDIIYTKEYFNLMKTKINKYNDSVVGLFGTVITDDFQSFYTKNKKRGISYRIFDMIDGDKAVHILGTGCLCYDVKNIIVEIEKFKHKNLADIQFALLGQQQKIPFIRVKHTNKNILKFNTKLNTKKTLYYNSLNKTGNAMDTSNQLDKIIKKNKWKIFSSRFRNIRKKRKERKKGKKKKKGIKEKIKKQIKERIEKQKKQINKLAKKGEKKYKKNKGKQPMVNLRKKNLVKYISNISNIS